MPRRLAGGRVISALDVEWVVDDCVCVPCAVVSVVQALVAPEAVVVYVTVDVTVPVVSVAMLVV